MLIYSDKANRRIVGWGNNTENYLKREMIRLGIRHRLNSPSARAAIRSLRTAFSRSHSLINRISYGIPRHMIFVHKGVGKGTPIHMVGNTRRVAKPWFNNVINQEIDALADIVAEETGNLIINNLLIK